MGGWLYPLCVRGWVNKSPPVYICEKCVHVDMEVRLSVRALRLIAATCLSSKEIQRDMSCSSFEGVHSLGHNDLCHQRSTLFLKKNWTIPVPVQCWPSTSWRQHASQRYPLLSKSDGDGRQVAKGRLYFPLSVLPTF